MTRNFEDYPVTLAEMIKVLRDYQAVVTAVGLVGDPRPYVLAKIIERIKNG